MRDRPREPRTYELLTILSPDVPEEEIPGQIDRIAGYVGAAGGTVQLTNRESPWGRRRLSYSIRHAGRDVRDGFYTLFRLDLAPDRVDDLERELKLNTQIIRYLVTHFSPKSIDQRAVEEAEIAAEQAAAEAYAAAQAEAARAAAATEAAAAAAEAEAVATTESPAPAEEQAATPDATETVEVQAEVEPAAPAADAISDEATESTTDATEPAEPAPAEPEAAPAAEPAQETTVAEAATEEPGADALAPPAAADEGASGPAAMNADGGERSSTTEEA